MSVLKAAVLAATEPLLLVLPASQIPLEWDFGGPGSQVLLPAGCVCHSSGLLHLRQAQEAADPPCACSIPAIPVPGFSDGM